MNNKKSHSVRSSQRPETLPAFRQVLVRALKAAGALHLSYARRGFSVSHKGLVDLVTDADRAAEKAIVRLIRQAYPNHGFVLEEEGIYPSTSPYRWIVDPLDGTVNYSHGLPLYCVSIAVAQGDRVLVGGVYAPVLNEMYLAVRGQGATKNGRRLHVSQKSKLIDSLLVTGFPYDRQHRAAFYLSFVQRALEEGQGLRRLGAAALDLCYVAEGRFEGYWEFNLKPWDAAAGWLIVEEAGGRVSDFHGRPYTLTRTTQTLATNGRIHPSMVRWFSSGLKGI